MKTNVVVLNLSLVTIFCCLFCLFVFVFVFCNVMQRSPQFFQSINFEEMGKKWDRMREYGRERLIPGFERGRQNNIVEDQGVQLV